MIKNIESTTLLWIAIGFLGQFLFFSRFMLQWYASEKAKKSMIPISFWYLSIVGSLFILAYSIFRKDIVFILGYSLNLIIYFRNLILIGKNKG